MKFLQGQVRLIKSLMPCLSGSIGDNSSLITIESEQRMTHKYLKNVRVADITTYPHVTAEIEVSVGQVGMYLDIDLGIGGNITCFIKDKDLKIVLEEIKALCGED